MKKYLCVVAAILLFGGGAPVEANLITGWFVGSVTGTGGIVSYPNGTPVSGGFGYDSDLLIFGNRTSYSDPNAFFYVDIAGQRFAGFDCLQSGLFFTIDDWGAPRTGTAAGGWDLSLGSGGFLGLWTPDNYVNAQVNYTVPDGAATAFLLGIALTGAAFVRRFAR